MITLKATIRKELKRKTDNLREQGMLPAVLYGDAIKENLLLTINEKDFEKVFREAGETSLVSIEVDGKIIEALIHQITKDPLSGKFLHIDFFHPSAKKKIEAEVPLIFENEAPAVKELGGVLEEELHFIKVKGLVHQLPHEFKVDLGVLKTFEDKIVVKDLDIQNVEVLHNPKDIIAHVVEPKIIIEEEAKPAVEGEDEALVEGEEGKTEEAPDKENLEDKPK